MNAIVIIPVYQPEPCLKNIVQKLWENENQIIIVDDGSDADKQDVFEELSNQAIILHHDENMGKGVAIKTALKYIKTDLWEYDVIGIMDGDGQHLVSDMERLIFKARKYPKQLILGVRKFCQKIPLRSKFGNIVTQKIFQISTGKKISDTQSGLRAFTRDRVNRFIEVAGDRYEYETQVLLTCAKEKIPIMEIEIETIYHDQGNSCSHFHPIKDSWRIYREFFKFSFVSISSFLLDYLLFMSLYFFYQYDVGALLMINVMARICSATYNYLMNTKVVFKQKVSAKSVGKYLLLAISILAFNNIFLQFYINLLHQASLAKIFTEISLFFVSFMVQKFGIYSNKTTDLVNRLKGQTKNETFYNHSRL